MFQVGNLNKGRFESVMNYVDGKLKIMGGKDENTLGTYIIDVEEFDFETMTWSLTGEELIDTTLNYDRGIAIPVSMLP